MDLYELTAKQREAVETLLEHGDVLTSSSHSLAITNADVQSIINGLPSSLPQKRKDVVKNAGSLVGKVNYFWGGKSSAIGWDSAWGTMQRVTAAGSPSSGTLRAVSYTHLVINQPHIREDFLKKIMRKSAE